MDKYLQALIVSVDKDLNRQLLKVIDKDFPGSVCHYVDSSAGLAKALNDTAIDIIISDTGPSGLDAFQALSLKLEIAPQIPFIVLSDDDSARSAVSAMRAGADDYILKNDIPDLNKSVTTLLANSGLKVHAHELNNEISRSRPLNKGIARPGPDSQANITGHQNQNNSGAHRQAVDKLNREIERRRQAEEEIIKLNEDLEIRNKTLEGDIAALRRLESALRHSEQRLQATFDNAALGIVEVDTDDRFISVNRRICQILGYSREELLGKSLHELTYPEDRQVTLEKNSQLHKGQYDIFEYEKRYLRRDGSPLWVHLTVSALRDKAGNFTGAIGTIENIEERKKAEFSLRAKESFIRHIIESIQDVFYTVDSGWNFTYVNNKALETWKKTRGELIGKNILDIFPEADGSEAFNGLRKAMDERIPVHYETYSPILNTWIEVSAYPANDSDLTVYFRDITDKKLGEQALQKALDAVREANERFENVLNKLPDAFVILDSQWRYVYLNDQSTRTMKRSLEELHGRVMWEEYPSMVGSLRYKMLHKVAADKTPLNFYDYSEVIRRWYEYLAFPWEGGVAFIARDITDKKQSEELIRDSQEKLKLSEERFRLALKYSPIAVFTQDTDLRYTWIYQSILDIPNEEFIGRTDSDFFSAEAAAKLNEIKKQVIDTGLPRHDKVSVNVGGMDYHFDMSVEPLINDRNELEGIACASINITDMVLLEAEKNKHEVTNIIERSARLASVGVVAGGITHEINQPLNAIRMSSGGILFWNKRNNNVLPGVLVEMLTGIDSAVSRIDQIVKSMRSLWADDKKDTIDTVNVNDTIDKVVGLNIQKIQNHNIAFVRNLFPDSVLVSVNELRLELVLINILNNSIHALDVSRTKRKAITVTSKITGGKVHILVEDNGIGLPAGVPEDRLYDPFFTTKPPEEGSGLGLAIAKMFLDRYGATIKAYNNDSGGATFEIIFNMVKKR